MVQPTENAEAQDDFGLALSLVLRTYLGAANAVLADLPGGPRGYHVLTSAAYECPPTQLALAQQLGIDRSVLTYLLDDLENVGLIERRPDPADRRARRIVVTRSGHTALKRLQRELVSAEGFALRGLDVAEQQTLRALLRRASTTQDTGEDACSVVSSIAQNL
jgi:DNA-binding MarR family transcriptional regulator